MVCLHGRGLTWLRWLSCNGVCGVRCVYMCVCVWVGFFQVVHVERTTTSVGILSYLPVCLVLCLPTCLPACLRICLPRYARESTYGVGSGICPAVLVDGQEEADIEI